MNTTTVMQIIKERDQALLDKYCSRGEHMTDNGAKTMYVCRPVDANEILEFMHQWDSALIEILCNGK